MKRLYSNSDLDAFLASLSPQVPSVLMLDYDGTLAPFVTDRTRAVPYPGVRERLERLMSSPTRLIVVSGRWSRDLLPLLDMTNPPEIWGCHGGERRLSDGKATNVKLPDMAVSGLVAVEEWARSEKIDNLVERKPGSVAFHWRGLTEETAKQLAVNVRMRWELLLKTWALELHEFDGGIEVRAVGVHKGVAVREILNECDDTSVVAYLGDDLTDEDAFDALGTNGLKVLVRKELRDTAADLWLTPPEELLWFFDRWLEGVSP